ncbi:MAG TPA: ROK family protein [Chloroflexota bacterium]
MLTRSYLVVDIGGSRVRVAVADSSLALAGRLDEPTDHSLGPESVVAQIAGMSRESCKRASVDWSDISSMVVACPGPLDARSGVVFDPPNLLGWHRVPLRDLLQEQLGVPVYIVNDANAAAFGEFHFGAGRGRRNLVYLTISTGIGGGVVVDGSLLEGTSGSGGELGHMTIDRHGPRCPCGNIGCLEVLGSGSAIARRYAECLAARGQFEAGTPTGADAREVARRAREGEPLAREVFLDAAEAVGTGVVNCINIFNPDVVVLGGGVTGAEDLLFDPVRRMAATYALPRPREFARIVPAELGPDVGLIGAAGVAVSRDASC